MAGSCAAASAADAFDDDELAIPSDLEAALTSGTVRRGTGGRHVPGGNLKKPLTMMGLATVAVTTLRTLARLHTVRTSAE